MQLFTALLVLVLAVTARSSLVCPGKPHEPYYVRANGYVFLGYRTTVPDVVSSSSDILLNNGVVVSSFVWGSQAITVGRDVSIGTGGRNIIFALDFDDVLFQEATNNQLVCELNESPPACESVCGVKNAYPCSDCAGDAPVDYSTKSVDDLIVNYDSKVTIQRKRKFRDIKVDFRGTLEIFAPGTVVITCRRFDMHADAKLVIQGSGSVIIKTEESIDIDERVVIDAKPSQLTMYQRSDIGYVYLGNAPSNRDHKINLNIIALADHMNGGYVHIGLNQNICGYISTKADLVMLHDSTIGACNYRPKKRPRKLLQ